MNLNILQEKSNMNRDCFILNMKFKVPGTKLHFIYESFFLPVLFLVWRIKSVKDVFFLFDLIFFFFALPVQCEKTAISKSFVSLHPKQCKESGYVTLQKHCCLFEQPDTKRLAQPIA